VNERRAADAAANRERTGRQDSIIKNIQPPSK